MGVADWTQGNKQVNKETSQGGKCWRKQNNCGGYLRPSRPRTPRNPVRPPLGGCSLSLTENLDRGRAIAHPCLGYLHLQLRGAVLLEHRVGQLLQKTIVRAHQLPRQKADD